MFGYTLIKKEELKQLRDELHKATQNDLVRLAHLADLQQRCNHYERSAEGHRRQWRETMKALYFALLHQGGFLEIARRQWRSLDQDAHWNVFVSEDMPTGNMKLQAKLPKDAS